MSEWQVQGGGRGRGGGQRGGGQRGGDQRGGGQRGGWGGRGGSEGRGGQYGSSGASSGHYRGGGGAPRGGRGDSRGDYRGDSRGRGRGGGRGGGSGGYEPDVFRQGAAIPQPDPEVTSAENAFIRDQSSPVSKLSSKAGKLAVSDPAPQPSTDVFPYRPAFGVSGQPITLWANYFKLNVKAQSLYKYDIDVSFKPAGAEAAAKTAPQPAKEAKGKGTKGGPGAKVAKGRKLQRIIQLAITQLPAGSVLATDFKDHAISLKRLVLPDSGVVRVQYTEPGRDRVETWDAKFNGPAPINVDRLLGYLRGMADPAGDTSFPKFSDEVNAIGVILGHTARADPGATALGRGRVFATDQRADPADMSPSNPLTILRGYFQSVRPATGRLLLNVNVTHGVFRRSLRVDKLFLDLQLAKMDSVGKLPDRERWGYLNSLKRIHKLLKRARIRCILPSPTGGDSAAHERVISGLASCKDSAAAEKPKFDLSAINFEFGGPTTTSFYLREPAPAQPSPQGLRYDAYCTVAQYYQAKYRRQPDARLPLLNLGAPGKPVYVPAEFCEIIPGQSMKTKLSPQDQDAMIRFACRAPPSNANSITTAARQLLGLDDNRLLTSFGISVDKELLTVTGRELPPPSIVYKGQQGVVPDNGSWLMKNVKVVKAGSPIQAWTYIYARDSQPRASVIQQTVGKFAGFMANNMGINISPKPVPASGIAANFGQEQEVRKAFAGLRQQRPRFILVVLPEKSTIYYNVVKKLADVEFGVSTVCVVEGKLLQEKGQFGYFANVALKVNLKFGGVNHQLRDEIGLVKTGKTMVVGYDVTHPTNLPSGASENLPSIVGLVASVDKDLGQWPALAWNNPSGKEMLGDELNTNFQSRLRLWQDRNKSLPQNIVIFRDGVSEGQFSQTLEQELPHIRKACEVMYRSSPIKKPRISLIVSVKRHHTRFYPTDPRHMHQRSKSPKEGTVVDRGVTNVRYWDYFLQAHASLQGTARPAHYTVLLDEIFRADYKGEAANALEKFTHDMCYLFGRATKSVSICPPAYYADLVCTRARVHKNELFDDPTDTESVSSAGQGRLQSIMGRSVHPDLRNSMYYI